MQFKGGGRRGFTLCFGPTPADPIKMSSATVYKGMTNPDLSGLSADRVYDKFRSACRRVV